jgi:hypothetical protein
LQAENDSNRSWSPLPVTTGSRLASRAARPASAYLLAATSATARSPAAKTSGRSTKPVKKVGLAIRPFGVAASAVARSRRWPSPVAARLDSSR